MDKHAARGKIDLSWHKLAGVYRAPAVKQRWRRARMEKCPDEIYRQLWRLVDGAVRDTFSNHPEYLTEAGKRGAMNSIVKRVVGSLHGYGAQASRGRSTASPGFQDVAAADEADSSLDVVSPWTRFSKAVSWVWLCGAHLAGGLQLRRPKFTDRGLK